MYLVFPKQVAHLLKPQREKMKITIKTILFYFLLQFHSGNLFSQRTQAELINAFNEQYIKMHMDEDFSKIKHHYSDSIRIMPEFQETILTRAHAEKYYQAFFERFDVKNYDRTVYEVLDLGTRIVEIGTFSILLLEKDSTYELKGKYLNIWKINLAGKPELFTEAWNYDHRVKFEERLKFNEVPSVRMALEPHVSISDNISFELAGLGALMERIISEKDGKLWSMFYDDNGISLHSFSPMCKGRDKLDEYYLAHAKEMPVFEKLDVRTDRIDELGAYVIEYATAIANWRMDQWSGVSTSKNIRIWKRQANGSLKIYRLIAMYDR